MKKFIFSSLGVSLVLLMFVSFNIKGRELATDKIIFKIDEKIDHEPNQKDIVIDEQSNFHTETTRDNDIQDKKELKKGNNAIKSQSDFEYLHGYNLTTASFSYQEDEEEYGDDFYYNNFIPQGLTKDKDGNLLISMYYEPHTCWTWSSGWYDCYDKHSIVVLYDPEDNVILNVFKIDDIDKGAHLGGIGYYHADAFPTYNPEWIFLSYGNTIRVYKYETIYLPIGRIKYILEYRDSYNIGYANSFMSSSYGYLWTGRYVESDDDYDRSFSGYKINYNDNYNFVHLTLKYKIKQPKFNVQGVYCDSDPEIETRLKFYFSASNNVTYVYQAVLTAKDKDNNLIVDKDSEYYWESYYTPYGYNSGTGRKLPDGGEGLVMKDDKLWMLNEGATDYYCSKLNWSEDDIDCAREILVINPVYFYDDQAYKVFPSGSIKITGSGLENFGNKVAIIFAQNKEGKLYYSIGEFDCQEGSCKMFLMEPSTPNPIGKQYNYSYYYNKRPKIFIEDIVGMYFMNLDEYGHAGDSDDFKMNKIIFTFDDNYYLTGDQDPYSIAAYIYRNFGDNISDIDVMELYFEFKYSNDEQSWDRGIKSYGNEMRHYVFDNLKDCYNNPYISYQQCRYNALDDVEAYLNSYGDYFLNNYINKDIDRMNNVKF